MKKFTYNPTLDKLLLTAAYIQKGKMKKATKTISTMLDHENISKDMAVLDKLQAMAKQSEMAGLKPRGYSKGDYVLVRSPTRTARAEQPYLDIEKEYFTVQLVSKPYVDPIFADYPEEEDRIWLVDFVAPMARKEGFWKSHAYWAKNEWRFESEFDADKLNKSVKWNPPKNLK